MLGYGYEKFIQAMSSLVGSNPQSVRLMGALMYLVRLKPADDVHPRVRQDFADFMKKMTSAPAKGDEGTMQATVNAMSPIEIERACEEIFSMFVEIHEAYLEDGEKIRKKAR